jgi:hypothetical protein
MGERVVTFKSLFIWRRIGFLGGTFYEECIESSQYLVALLTGNLQGAPDVSTLQDNMVGGRCFASFRWIWDLGIIISFNLVQFFIPMGVMALIEDNQSLGREDLSCPHFWIPLFCSGDDFRGSSVKKKGVKKGLFNVT